jgi:pyrroline-5-carboxylate reductase
MAEVLASISAVVSKDALFISIAAGKSSAFIERHLGPAAPWRIIRAMPNTPMLVGEGMVALCRGRHASADDLQIARQLFQTSAAVIDVDEDKMDAVTAMSGSGPAYFFYLVEQMIAAGISLGLTPEQSHTLATRTALGAAKMLTSSADSPKELRKKVTSPGGTTQAAIETMEAQHVNEAIVAAIRRAAERGRELAG